MDATMLAMRLERIGGPLVARRLPLPQPGHGQLRLRVLACGVCRTDLHVHDGELPEPRLPLTLGHEVVGEVDALGTGVTGLSPGQRVGIPWLGHTCGVCRFCRSGRENLCDTPGFTGYTLDGGYAEYAVADSRYCFPLAVDLDPAHTAPLLCAGLIGYRALRLAGQAARVGLYGFGAAAHILCQLLVAEGREVFAFVRQGDTAGCQFALAVGAHWAGFSEQAPPEPLDAAIIFAPVGALVPLALRALDKGGRVVCAGIHMSDIPAFPYADLWQERSICSVANLTRADGEEFLALAARTPLQTHVTGYPLAQANEALAALRHGQLQGAAVLLPQWPKTP